MRDTLSALARLLSVVGLCLAIATGNGCASGEAETAGDAGPPPNPLSAGTVKFHVVLGDGPFKGTYDVASDACLAGVMKAGSWHATWEAETSAKDKISAVLVGLDPKPTFGNGLTTMVGFGGDGEDKVIYEVQKPETIVNDKGATATLTFKGKARVAFYKDGSFADGGQVEITIECGTVRRG
ncbi:MAG: hypothetical protein JJE40_09205 [Vicinamibacteria bacterium]|nr:hypothetical protein [Vicinamibacteria bacterium]